MELRNNLTIRVKSFSDIVLDTHLLQMLRKLTLHHFSGMNHELNNFEKLSKIRKVNAQVLLAYIENELVGWALLSSEPSNFLFGKHFKNYEPSYGSLFQVYVAPVHRRKGIGSELLKIARHKIYPHKLCICPWNSTSNKFYDKFKHYRNKKI